MSLFLFGTLIVYLSKHIAYLFLCIYQLAFQSIGLSMLSSIVYIYLPVYSCVCLSMLQNKSRCISCVYYELTGKGNNKYMRIVLPNIKTVKIYTPELMQNCEWFCDCIYLKLFWNVHSQYFSIYFETCITLYFQ